MRSFQHRAELRLALVAVIGLLIAQLGAVAHVYAHDTAASAASHRGALNSHDLCNDCLAYAPLLSAAGAPSLMPFTISRGRDVTPGAITAPRPGRSLRLAFRSRAPPRTR